MILPAAVCCLVLGLLSPFVIIPLLLRRGVVDVPNERSSHTSATVRGGGIVVCLAFCAGVTSYCLSLLAYSHPIAIPLPFLGVTFALLGAGGIGLAEDIRGLSVAHRLVLQGLLVASASLLLISSSERILVAIALASVMGIFYVNASNFMDGINGLSAAQGIVVGIYYAALGHHRSDTFATAAAIMIASASIAFAPWNFPRARMFLGDVGSYALGAGAWSLAVWAMVAGTYPPVALAPLTILVTDVVWTLGDRLRRHQPLTLPHRHHLYQQLASLTSHGYATSVVTGSTVICGMAGALHVYANLSTRALVVTLVFVAAAYVCAAVPVTRVLSAKIMEGRTLSTETARFGDQS